MVAVAERLFSEHGYEGVSMDAIAAECGVTKPMLYSYFGSKDGLFVACGVAGGERLRARVATAVESATDPAERLWRGLRTIFTRIGENREMWMLLYDPDAPATSAPLAARAAMNRAAMVVLVAGWLRDAAESAGLAPESVEQTQPLAHAVVGAALGVAGWWFKHPEEPAELQALRVMNFAWNGLERLQQGHFWAPGAEATN